ncbi:hypothetical protein BV20DRAFT_1032804 [Pilatotrama ljubarskyi]|nr:hypothetical protein BV20DRAFT_1032804 [Pilatotrama ljubarskyi]
MSLAWDADACLAAFQGANDRYWAEHGLSMAHSVITSAARPAAASLGAAIPLIQPSYEVLPQRTYVAKRHFQRKPPIPFRTAFTPYVKLVDALTGNVWHLNDGEDAVFLGEHLTQKQSLRLEIVGQMSFERQINVRSPSGSFRSITRAKLAEKIAKEVFDYMNRRQRSSFGPPSFNMGPGTRGFERIVLLELCHVSRASWQPVLGVLRLRGGGPSP